jgi:hypothetical protein
MHKDTFEPGSPNLHRGRRGQSFALHLQLADVGNPLIKRYPLNVRFPLR